MAQPTEEQAELQRAKWRVQRALQASKEPQEADLLLLGTELVDKIRVTVGRKEQPQQTQSQSSQAPTPSRASPVMIAGPKSQEQTKGHQQAGESQAGAADTKAKVGSPKRRPLTKEERAWQDFYASQFGPIVVLLLWLGFRNQEKALFYAPQPDEMQAIAPHAARLSNWLVEKLNIPDTAVEVLFNTNDVIDVCYIVVGYLSRIGVLNDMIPWLGEKFEKVREDLANGQRPEENAGRAESVPAAGSNGRVAEFDLSNIRGLGGQYTAD